MFILTLSLILSGVYADVKVFHPHALPISKFEGESGEKRADVPRLMMEVSDFNDDSQNANGSLVVYYSFEKRTSGTARIKDESSFDNNGIIGIGGIIVQIPDSSCKSAAYLWGQDIKISFSTPDGAPKYGFSFSAWIKLMIVNPQRRVLEIRGSRFGMMALEIHSKLVSFYHKACPTCPDKFRVNGYASVTRDWFNLVATYNAVTGNAQVYFNGIPLNRTWNKFAAPFRYWGADVRIGGARSSLPLKGFIDEIRMYNYELSTQEVSFLSMSCSFQNSKGGGQMVYARSSIEPMAEKRELNDDSSSDLVDHSAEPENTGTQAEDTYID